MKAIIGAENVDSAPRMKRRGASERIVTVLAIFSGATRWIILGALVLLNVLGLPARIRRAKQTQK